MTEKITRAQWDLLRIRFPYDREVFCKYLFNKDLSDLTKSEASILISRMVDLNMFNLIKEEMSRPISNSEK